MKQIKIIDACFPQARSMSAKGENAGLKPAYFEWYRGSEYRDTHFFTDSTFHLAAETEAQLKVAWLLEPYPFRQSTYDYVQNNQHLFDYVLTYSQFYLRENEDWLFYPYGGSMIHPDRWGIKPKSKLCSIIVSDKNEATGHRLRHEIVRRFGDKVDVLGSGYGNYVDKYDGLADYAYSIAVEGERLNWCFDEKLIDCLALGTIPIYWGCPEIDLFFHPGGIISFDHVSDVGIILEHLMNGDHNRHLAIKDNFNRAKKYICVEDWLYNEYPFLFYI